MALVYRPEYKCAMLAHGTFETFAAFEPPYDDHGGVALVRGAFDKRFEGDLVGASKVHLLQARTKVPGSSSYVAMERVHGVLGGRRGSFVMLHTALMGHGSRSHAIQVVPDSGTQELTGIAGRMEIHVEQGQRLYTLDYRFVAG
jgi:Protein of unknown function (DUF3224)